jgi:O-antigen/teichoic acid export membrane protein
MLERMLPDGKEQAGIYAQGFRILDAAAMFAFLYAGLLLPMFSRMIKQKKSIHQLTLFSFLLLIVPVVGITFASYFYRTELIDLLYHHHVDTSATIFGILILCFLGISTSYIFGTLLTANGDLRKLNIMAVGGVIVNITLNFILIPKYYALGSAIASLVTQTFVAILQVLLAKKIFQFSVDLKRIVIFVLFISVVFLFSMFSVHFDFNWIYKFIAILVFTMILAFLLRLLHLKVFVDLLKNGDE